MYESLVTLVLLLVVLVSVRGSLRQSVCPQRTGDHQEAPQDPRKLQTLQ